MTTPFRVEGHNPNWQAPTDRLDKYFPEINPEFKEMWPWQEEAFEKGKDARFFTAQAFCGSGKSILQVQLATYDVIKSNYTQKQLIVVPQQHIHNGFVGSDRGYMSFLQNGKKYEWLIQPEHNFCTTEKRVDELKRWLLTPSKKLATGFTDETISGLNAVCSHAALVAAWKKCSPAQKKIAIRRLTLRIDEAHHINHVFLDGETFVKGQQLKIEKDATNLGRICKFLINSKCKTCKLHLGTATFYRGDCTIILSAAARKKFVEYNLDWIEHFSGLGIERFFLQYEEYKINPINMIMERIKKELKEKHFVVIPSTGNKWRDARSLAKLLKELHKIYPEERVLDLVTQATQDDNKIKLLAEPKVHSKENPSKFDVVVVCMLGREGTDWCPCSRIYNASMESSITLAVQTIGRAFRRYEGKRIVKIFHYIKQFTMPKKGITKTELFIDRTNGLLICMLIDDMNNSIIIPCAPDGSASEAAATDSNGPSTTLGEVFGDQYFKAMQMLFQGYELLEEKTTETLHNLADRICEFYEITENVENIRLGLVARLVRMASKSPKLKGVDVAFVRKNGFNLIKMHDSIHFANCKKEDWLELKELIKSLKKLSDMTDEEKLAETKRDFAGLDVTAIKSDYKHYGFLNEHRKIRNEKKSGL